MRYKEITFVATVSLDRNAEDFIDFVIGKLSVFYDDKGHVLWRSDDDNSARRNVYPSRHTMVSDSGETIKIWYTVEFDGRKYDDVEYLSELQYLKTDPY